MISRCSAALMRSIVPTVSPRSWTAVRPMLCAVELPLQLFEAVAHGRKLTPDAIRRAAPGLDREALGYDRELGDAGRETRGHEAQIAARLHLAERSLDVAEPRPVDHELAAEVDELVEAIDVDADRLAASTARASAPELLGLPRLDCGVWAGEPGQAPMGRPAPARPRRDRIPRSASRPPAAPARRARGSRGSAAAALRRHPRSPGRSLSSAPGSRLSLSRSGHAVASMSPASRHLLSSMKAWRSASSDIRIEAQTQDEALLDIGGSSTESTSAGVPSGRRCGKRRCDRNCRASFLSECRGEVGARNPLGSSTAS